MLKKLSSLPRVRAIYESSLTENSKNHSGLNHHVLNSSRSYKASHSLSRAKTVYSIVELCTTNTRNNLKQDLHPHPWMHANITHSCCAFVAALTNFCSKLRGTPVPKYVPDIYRCMLQFQSGTSADLERWTQRDRVQRFWNQCGN